MKRALIVLSCLMLAGLAVAQERTGNINGLVTDLEKNPLPGVTVTLTGLTTSPIATTTSAEGKFRFLSLFPGREYQVKLELQGFKTGIQTGIIVELGKNTDLTLLIEQGKLEEQITVVAPDARRPGRRRKSPPTSAPAPLQSLPFRARSPRSCCRWPPRSSSTARMCRQLGSGQQSHDVEEAGGQE